MLSACNGMLIWSRIYDMKAETEKWAGVFNPGEMSNTFLQKTYRESFLLHADNQRSG